MNFFVIKSFGDDHPFLEPMDFNKKVFFFAGRGGTMAGQRQIRAILDIDGAALQMGGDAQA